ncbi:glycosyltransferase [Asanoa ferruginea]|uniref:glycosyltransferase n=1 Tax=Asanoa ferruginea TaxID=53367 RepID=UPI000E252C4E|nr:glycosyltransferase family 2 protein [Asanoa ferruginea]
MVSIVVAAHNEATVIGRTLRHLLAGAELGEFDVVVAANGCTDDTAGAARAVPGVRVVEVERASKPAALNAGDAAAASFPRIYLDADITLDAAGARALAAAVSGPSGVIAAAPRRVLDVKGRPLLVRAYFAVNGRLPAFRDALFGRGAIVLSKDARARFDEFPDQFADDLFLDALFAVGEKREIAAVRSVVATPTRTADLLRRLGRVRSANTTLREVSKNAGVAVRPVRKASWLVDVVLPRPWLWPAGACYAALTLLAERRARRTPAGAAWARDESTRS